MAGGAALLGRHRSAERVPGHAYAVPAGEDRIIVEVLNGSGRLGMARTAARLLRREGIDVVYLGNADATGDSTTLFVRRGPRARGDQVRAALRAGRVMERADTLRRVDVTVFLGRDFRPKVELHP